VRGIFLHVEQDIRIHSDCIFLNNERIVCEKIKVLVGILVPVYLASIKNDQFSCARTNITTVAILCLVIVDMRQATESLVTHLQPRNKLCNNCNTEQSKLKKNIS